MKSSLEEEIKIFDNHLLHTFGDVGNKNFYCILKSAILSAKESDFQLNGYALPLDFYIGIVSGISIGWIKSISNDSFEKKVIEAYENYTLPKTNLNGEITSMFYNGLAKGIIYSVQKRDCEIGTNIFKKLIDSVTNPYIISESSELSIPSYINPKGKINYKDIIKSSKTIWPEKNNNNPYYKSDTPLVG